MKRLIMVLMSFFISSCIAIDLLMDHSLSPHAIEENESFDVAWTVSNVSIRRSDRTPQIVSVPGKIIILGHAEGSVGSRVVAFDSLSGKKLWQTSRFYSGGYILAHDQVLYLGSIGGAEAVAYNTEDGEMLWRTVLPWAASTMEIHFAENKLFIFTSDNEFFILDEQGKIIETRGESYYPYFEAGGVFYVGEYKALKAVDISTRKEIWQLKTDEEFTHSPVFDSGAIFLRTWRNPGYVYSIDQATGKVNWKVSQNALSNLCVVNDKIYFIDFDSYLVAIDRHSGEEITRVKITPSIDWSNGTDFYFIGADPTNNALALYFGDAGQLLGVKIKKPAFSR
jgi:outer membrane protein assembly factor BamB